MAAEHLENAVLHILERADSALSAGEVKQALVAAGVDALEADRSWPRIQRRIRSHERVVVEGGYRYRWVEPLPGPGEYRHLEIPLVRALAELAIEVEELSVNGASAHAMIHRIRARVKRNDLEPVDRAGDQSTMDHTRHEPIGHPIHDGTPVVVIRPGYVWRSPNGDVLIARAVVQDRS